MTTPPARVSRSPGLEAARRVACPLLAVLAALSAGPVLASDADTAAVTEGIRGELESQFRATTGLGFKAFDCDFPNGWPASREIACRATDDEDDRFFYRVMRLGGQDEPLITMRQPVGQLNPDGLASLARPGDAFISAFGRSDWPAVMASLSPAFEAQLGIEGIRNILAPIKAQVGTITGSQAVYYATPEEGLHQLDYALATDQGEAVARFRLRFDTGNQPQIVSFLITAEPGNPLHATLLETTGKSVLARFFDQPIERIEGALDRLAFIGDHEEVNLVLEDGSLVKARVEQHGSTWDMDSNDYRYQVLDAEMLIGWHLESVNHVFASIKCPADVAPDGGSLDCVVTNPNGSSSTLRLLRRGGDHRLVEAE